ncbi:MAG: thioredoxin family protein [Verrucomicrobiaceae bacterium]|nr:MAG: thioredoxin family protein [Verrucomicrobiaceae bacterium]
MNLKSWLGTSVVLVALSWSGIALAGGEGWTSDFAAAKKQAAESKKDLLIDFTGSDWCGWCIKLNHEVFKHEPFKAGVKDSFVLVELDYPKDKSKLSDETLKQNEELGKQYQVAGYPTILLCDAGGKPYAATGYRPGGPEEYVKQLDELRKRKTARDEALASAAKSQGVEKAKLLAGAITSMGLTDGMVASFYGDVIEEIKASDPKDETGFGKSAALKVRIAGIKQELGGFMQKKDTAGALGVLDKALKDGGLPDGEVQQIMLTRGIIFAEEKKFDEAVKALDEAKAVDPESRYGAAVEGIKEKILQQKEKDAAPAPAAGE